MVPQLLRCGNGVCVSPELPKIQNPLCERVGGAMAVRHHRAPSHQFKICLHKHFRRASGAQRFVLTSLLAALKLNKNWRSTIGCYLVTKTG
jgi:hypothetical protein